MLDVEPLGRLLWARSAPESAAERFLENITEEGRKYTVVVSGHDPVSEGFDKAEKNQLVLSTSFRWRWHQQADWVGAHRIRVKNVSIPLPLWSYLGNQQGRENQSAVEVG
jgi:hypothetical protein